VIEGGAEADTEGDGEASAEDGGATEPTATSGAGALVAASP